MSADEAARRELEWLRTVGAVRRVEDTEAGFVVTLADGCLVELPPEAVVPFKRGVLVGYRLPRPSGVLG